MAKGRKRSNREVREPKAVQTAATASPSTLSTKSPCAAITLVDKKKGGTQF